MACVTRRRDRWVLDYYDNDQQRHCKFMPEGSTQNEGIQKLAEILRELGQDASGLVKDIPLFPEFADLWLGSKKANIRHSTHEQYGGHLKNHLKPYFKQFKVNEVEFEAIEKFKKHSLDQSVTPPTLRKLLVTLGAVLTYACKMRYRDHNPIRDVEKPKGNSLKGEKKEMIILKPKELRALLDNTDSPKAKALFTIAILSGARQGELLGLEWGDVDWRNSQILIRRTFNHGNLMEPKSPRARRRIDIAPEGMQVLREWRMASLYKKDSDPIFPSEVGTHWDAAHMITRCYFPALKKAKLPRINFHSLRHGYASLLIDQGENPKYIQTQMGHSSINITMDIYGHLFKEVNPEAAKKLGKKIFEQKEENLNESDLKTAEAGR